MTESTPRVAWTQEEARVLVAIFFGASFSIGDDARDECRAIADAFGRTPSSVDRQWRNVQAVVNGNTTYNIGKIIKVSVSEYLDNPKAMKQIAIQISENFQWGLEDLIRSGQIANGRVSEVSRLDDAPPDHQLMSGLNRVLDVMSAKTYTSGALGFFAQGKVQDEARAQYQAQFSAVLIGSKHMESPNMLARTDEVVAAVKEKLGRLQPKRFASGRTGYFGNAKFEIAQERFQVTMQVVHIRRESK